MISSWTSCIGFKTGNSLALNKVPTKKSDKFVRQLSFIPPRHNNCMRSTMQNGYSAVKGVFWVVCHSPALMRMVGTLVEKIVIHISPIRDWQINGNHKQAMVEQKYISEGQNKTMRGLPSLIHKRRMLSHTKPSPRKPNQQYHTRHSS
ncbi:hypothetical protein VNO77_24137 [Canavalia gladiata]|uniref:Uncharacterized protein n=1 Tax=Canavalia gladiata TaxID=3824 RepID=A0AAN9L676_CANGL